MAKLYRVCQRKLFFDATTSRREPFDRGPGSNRCEKQRPGNARRRVNEKKTEALSKLDGEGPEYCRVTTKSAIRSMNYMWRNGSSRLSPEAFWASRSSDLVTKSFEPRPTA